MANQVSSGFFPIANGELPAESGRGTNVRVNWVAQGGAPYTGDLYEAVENGALTLVQSLFVDNADVAETVIILMNGSYQRIEVPPNAQGFIPVFSAGTAAFSISSAATTGTTQVTFLNMPLPAMVWPVEGYGGGGGGGNPLDTFEAAFPATGRAIGAQVVSGNLSQGPGEFGPLTTNSQGQLLVSWVNGAGGAVMSGAIGASGGNALQAGSNWAETPPDPSAFAPGIAMGLQSDQDGNLMVNVSGRHSALNLTAGTHILKGNQGYIRKLIVQTVSSTPTVIFDAATGAATAANTIYTVPAGATAGSIIEIEFPCQVGLSITVGTAGVFAVSYA